MKRRRNAEMAAPGVSVLVTVCLSLSVHPGYGFKVIQPRNRIVDPDGLVVIRCEHDANVTSVTDARLNRITPDGQRTLLCQKGKHQCEDAFMHSNNPQKWLFILVNVGAEAANVQYECEFTLDENDLHNTERGKPTRLLKGEPETERDCVPPSPLPPAPPFDQLIWILIGLLALMFLGICVIGCFYVKLRRSRDDPENCVYVEMRKAPLPRNPAFDIYHFG